MEYKKYIILILLFFVTFISPLRADEDLFDKFCVKEFNKDSCLAIAIKSDSASQYVVGRMYEQGIIDARRDTKGLITNLGKPDYSEAKKWFEIASRNGDSGSAYRLAEINYRGLGTTRNYLEAYKWYRIASKANTPYAILQLSDMYEQGHGVQKNFIKSHMWLLVAIYSFEQNKLEASDLYKILRKEEDGLNTDMVNTAQLWAKDCIDSKFINCHDD